MDKTPLVERDIEAGSELVGKLADAEFPFNAALWYFDSDAEDWRFIIATELVDTLGPTKTYKKLNRILASFPGFAVPTISELTPMKVMVVSPEHNLIKLLISAVRTGAGPSISPIRFTRNVVNGTLIEDAYIYRMTSPTRNRQGAA